MFRTQVAWCQGALKRCVYCIVLFVTVWGATVSAGHMSRENKHSRLVFCIFYSIPFYFIQYMCLSTMQFLLPSLPRHIHFEPQPTCLCLCGCSGVQRKVPQVQIQSHHICAVPVIAFFSLIVPLLNAEKIDIHWSIAKRSKYCPPQKVACLQKKCRTVHCLHETK